MTGTSFDARRFKAIERAGFNRIAARYAEGAHLRAALTDALLDAAALEPGQRVLDLASGPGLLARAALGRVLPGGHVVASDIAEEMLAEGARRFAAETAQERETGADAGRPARRAGHSAPDDRISRAGDSGERESLPPTDGLSFVAADAEHLCLPDGEFDRVLAGLALFMFPHPDRALTEIRRVLRPGGRVVLSVWGTRNEMPLIACAQDCIARLLPAPKVARPSVFRFGEPAVLRAALEVAGFTHVRIEPCRFTCRFPDAEAYWQAFLDLAGGAAESLARLPGDTQAKLREAVGADLAAHHDPAGGYAVDALALVASAHA